MGGFIMFDIIFSSIGLLSIGTILFIFGFFAFLIYKFNELSKQPPSPPLVKDDE